MPPRKPHHFDFRVAFGAVIESEFRYRDKPPNEIVVQVGGPLTPYGPAHELAGAHKKPAQAPFMQSLRWAKVPEHLKRMMTQVSGPSFLLLAAEGFGCENEAGDAVRALERYLPAALQPLLEILTMSSYHPTTDAAVEVLRLHGEPVVQRLAELVRLDALDFYTRERLASVLWGIDSLGAQEVLSNLISDPSRDTRDAVIGGLVRPKVPGAFEMCARLTADADSRVRYRAIGKLGEFQDERAVQALRTMATNHTDHYHRDALEALGKIKLPSAERILLDVWLAPTGTHDAECRKIVHEARPHLSAQQVPQSP